MDDKIKMMLPPENGAAQIPSVAPCYTMDIVDAGDQATEALKELDGSPAGLIRANVKARNLIFAAYHLGRSDFEV